MQNGPASFEAGPLGKTSAMHGVTTLRERGATTRCCRYTVSYAGDYTTSVPRVSYHTITNRASILNYGYHPYRLPATNALKPLSLDAPSAIIFLFIVFSFLNRFV